MFRILERMRALDGVVTVDSWTHLEVYKERYTGTVPRPRRAGRTPANQA
ncbi:hypothetical protein P9209_02650 [Prescottella defluvii]|nr:hypothetical protein P9209_02650 [Prescottella defluvii]